MKQLINSLLKRHESFPNLPQPLLSPNLNFLSVNNKAHVVALLQTHHVLTPASAQAAPQSSLALFAFPTLNIPPKKKTNKQKQTIAYPPFSMLKLDAISFCTATISECGTVSPCCPLIPQPLTDLKQSLVFYSQIPTTEYIPCSTVTQLATQRKRQEGRYIVV